MCVLFILLLQDRIQSRTLLVGMGNSDKVANSGRRSSVKGRLLLNPRGVAHSNRDVRTLYVCPKIQKYAQGIIHDGAARGHTTVLDTEAQQYMVWVGVWEIIHRNDKWIYAQGVNMGCSSKAGCHLQLVDAICVGGGIWMISAT